MIDVRTTYALTALVLMLAPLGILLTTRGFRNHQITCWVLANLLSGVGFGLVMLRGAVPDLVSFHLAQALMLLGMFLRIHAIRILESPGSFGLTRENLRPFAFWFVGYMGMFTWAMAAAWSDLWRITGVIVAHMVLLVWFLQRAGRLEQRQPSEGLKLLQLAILIMLIGFALRLVSMHALQEDAHVFAAAPLHNVSALLLMSFALLSNIAFHRLILEGIDQDRTQAKDALAESQGAASRYALQTPGVSIEAFGSAISHELNQPLTAIALNVSHLQQQMSSKGGRDDREEVLRDLMADTRRAAALVTNLRILLANQQSAREEVAIQAAVHEAAALLQRSPVAQQRPISINVSAPDQDLLVMANADQLVQVFLNLMVNAAEAFATEPTQQPAQISVSVTQNDDAVEVCVTDNGPGVPPELRDKLFDLFSSTKPREGGVGLWLAKTILLSHDASISLDATHAPGTRFVMVFPRVHQRP
jgi:signal transduction histidine kinase